MNSSLELNIMIQHHQYSLQKIDYLIHHRQWQVHQISTTIPNILAQREETTLIILRAGHQWIQSNLIKAANMIPPILVVPQLRQARAQ